MIISKVVDNITIVRQMKLHINIHGNSTLGSIVGNFLCYAHALCGHAPAQNNYTIFILICIYTYNV